MHCRTLVLISTGGLLGGTTLAASAAGIAAQTPDASEALVTLGVTPREIPVNGQVTMSGLGYPQTSAPITVTVTPPTGAATTLTTMPDADGHYRVTFTRARAPGVYQVAARVGAQGSPAHGTFSAKTYARVIDDDAVDNKAFLEEMTQLVQAARRGIDDLPDSPAKAEMQARLTALGITAEPLPRQSAKLAAALQHFKAIVAEHREAEPALQALFDRLAQLDEETKMRRAPLARQIQESRQHLQTCEAIDRAAQALQAVPDMIAILERPYQFAVSFATDLARSDVPLEAGQGIGAAGILTTGLLEAVGAPAEPVAAGEIEIGSESDIADSVVKRARESLRRTPGYAVAVSETRRLLPLLVDDTRGPLERLDKAATVAGDVWIYASDELFATYCQKLEGQFTATMLAHFFSQPNRGAPSAEWWTYSTALAGTVVLRYPKDAPGPSIALRGQLEGRATRFTYRENVFTSGVFGSVARGGSVLLKDVAPTATDAASRRRADALSSPTTFSIPVTGRLRDGTVTLNVGEARTDFDDRYTRGHTFYVVIAPTTQWRPVLGHFSLPYSNARFVLDQVVNGDYVIQQSGPSRWVQRDTTRDRPANQNDAVYTLHLKACHPSCGGS